MAIFDIPNNCAVCGACKELTRDEYQCGFTDEPLDYAGLCCSRGTSCPLVPATRLLLYAGAAIGIAAMIARKVH